MKYKLLVCLVLLLCIEGKSEIKNQEGSYSVSVTPYLSRNKAIAMAHQEAKKKAIRIAFGSTIAEIMVHDVVDENEAKHASNEHFSAISRDISVGVWLEDLQPADTTFGKDDLDQTMVTVSVYGKVRKVEKALTQLAIAPSRVPDSKSQATKFENGDRFYLNFKSPINGYLAVYLVDENKTAYRLLPFPGEESCPIELDKQYCLFDKKNTPNAPPIFGGYQLQLNDKKNETEVQTLWVVFSPNKFDKPLDNAEEITSNGTFVLPSLREQKLYNWMVDNYVIDTAFQWEFRRLIIQHK